VKEAPGAPTGPNSTTPPPPPPSSTTTTARRSGRNAGAVDVSGGAKVAPAADSNGTVKTPLRRKTRSSTALGNLNYSAPASNESINASFLFLFPSDGMDEQRRQRATVATWRQAPADSSSSRRRRHRSSSSTSNNITSSTSNNNNIQPLRAALINSLPAANDAEYRETAGESETEAKLRKMKP